MNKSEVYINIRKNIFLIIFAIFSFLLPLVVSSSTNELYEFPKMYFAYFFGASFICFYLIVQTVSPKKLRVLPIYIKLYLLSFLVSTIFSVHSYTSIWGYYSRFNDGLMSTLLFFGLYFIARNKLSKEDFNKIFKIILIVSVPISIVAINEHSAVTRVYSTFGQANWLAQYYAMVLPLINFMYLTNTNVILWFVLSILGFAGMWFTYSLSGFMGYFAALVSLVVINYKYIFAGVVNKPNVYKFIFLILSMVVIAFTNLGVFRLRVNDVFNDVVNFITYSPLVYAQTQESTASQRNLSDTGFIRFGLWEGTLKMVFATPVNALIGTGPETFPYSFQKFRPLELNYSSEWNFVFNKPHNYYLEIAAEQGLIGLGIYLFLLYILFKNLEKEYIPLLIAFAVTNIFGWPTVFTSYVFWMLLASIPDKNVVKTS